MVNGKRSTYRRKGRRGNRSLSTRRIFNNKSAKAQASQIYALRKSINRVRRQCRPEIKEVVTDYEDRLLARAGPAGSITAAVFRTPVPSIGTGDDGRIGDMVKILPCKFRFNLYYKEVYGTVEGSTVWNVPELTTHGMQIRIFALQLKAATSTLPTFTEVLDGYNGNTDPLQTMANMTRNFTKGITAKYSVLFNRVYSVSKDSPVLSRTIKIVPRIKHLRWDESGNTYPRGQIVIFVCEGGAVNRVVVADPDNFYDYNATSILFNMSQAYTDA